MKRKEGARAPFIVRRKLQDTGTSFTISIPKEWFKGHGLDPKKVEDLLLVGDKHILVLNPNERDIYSLVSDYIDGKAPDTDIEKALLDRIRKKAAE